MLAKAILVKLETIKLAGMGKWERLRYQLDKARAANGGELPAPHNLAEIIEAGRKRAQERNDSNGIPEPALTVQAAPSASPDLAHCKAEWRELRKANPNAGGDGVSILLGEPVQRKPAEIKPEEETAIKRKRVPTKREREIEAADNAALWPWQHKTRRSVSGRQRRLHGLKPVDESK